MIRRNSKNAPSVWTTSTRQYVAVDDIHLNGKLTLGENVADLGGEILAYIAWKDATKDMKLETKDGLTPSSAYFVGFAQWDCANERPEQRTRMGDDESALPGEIPHQRGGA